MKFSVRHILYFAFLLNIFCVYSCRGGDTVDGITTERVELYTGDGSAGGKPSPTDDDKMLYEKVIGFFDIYYSGTRHTVSYDSDERGEFGGDECKIFRSFFEDGSEGLLIAASVDGKNIYGSDSGRGLIALIWCEGWTEPDFSYFGENDTSNLFNVFADENPLNIY